MQTAGMTNTKHHSACRPRSWGAVAALALLAACASTPGTGSSSAESTTLQELAARHHVCGVAVAVVKQRLLQSIETASGCDPATAVRADSVFQAASLSKPVFAYAVLKLAEQGKLALDAPVLQYLPQGYEHAFDPLEAGPSAKRDPVTDPRLRAVTVRMLLNHTSGLPNWASGPLRFEGTPGERWEYSGEGYVLLQRVVEAVTGQRLDEVMDGQVFAPLGMAHSSYSWTPQLGEHLLPGTKPNGARRTTMLLKQPVSAFSLHTTAEDYGRFLAAVLRDAPLLATTLGSPVDVDARLGLGWGLGWGIERSPDRPQGRAEPSPPPAGVEATWGGPAFPQEEVYLWQWGNNPGYRAFVIASPRSGDGLVMLTNSEGGLKLAEPVVQARLPGGHTVFRAPFLAGGFTDVLCDVVRLCL